MSILQKKAVRIVASENYNAYTQPIFKKLKILPFDKLILYFNLQLMQKFQHGFLPTSFSQTWSDNRVRRGNQLEILDFSKKGKSFKHPLC